ncbi:hypothetical protein ElyMa_004165400 [Elysia marginata]|uniref:Uncharacterized protein n=1 Tax=Elysia marginata TaxID=1093978 RepID=A0AAV4GKA7_9GAST|nr:hypothetical protein ElyMa_004165400 [Elysia marginata]
MLRALSSARHESFSPIQSVSHGPEDVTVEMDKVTWEMSPHHVMFTSGRPERGSEPLNPTRFDRVRVGGCEKYSLMPSLSWFSSTDNHARSQHNHYTRRAQAAGHANTVRSQLANNNNLQRHRCLNSPSKSTSNRKSMKSGSKDEQSIRGHPRPGKVRDVYYSGELTRNARYVDGT